MTADPFRALGLPARPDLDDERVRAAWREIAAATHPDRADGGDPARYSQASAAYAELRTPWGRSEAYADLLDAEAAEAGGSGGAPDPMPLGRLAARLGHGRPGRVAARALVTVLACAAVVALVPGQPAEPALVTGLVTWFLLASRGDLAPPPER